MSAEEVEPNPLEPLLALARPPVERQLPEGVEVAAGVDLDADDPTWTETPQGLRRKCIALASSGSRCRASAAAGQLLCNAHAGKLDHSAGGRALADKRRQTREEAENRVVERRMGLRGALSAQLQRRIHDVEAAVDHLLDAAAGGDTKAAMSLLPWIDQALGKVTTTAEAGTAQDDASTRPEAMPTRDLKALVAAGRARRLRAVD